MYSKNLVYGLVDPRTQQLRYIGKTMRGEIRFREHVSVEAMKRRTRTRNWIKHLLDQGLSPEPWVIESVDDPNALPELEQEYIAYFKFIGCDLTNHTNGGEGLHGYRPSKETRAKQRAAKIGTHHKLGYKATPEQRARIAKGNLGKNRGEKNWCTKLTEGDVRQIRSRYAEGGTSYGKLGKEFGVATEHVFRIVKRKVWTWLS